MTDNAAAAASFPPFYPPRVAIPPKPLPFARYLARFVINPVSTLPQQVYEAPIVSYGSGRVFVVWVTGPDLIERILLRESDGFPKTPIEKRVLGPTLGAGILTSEGEVWRWQRKVAAPLFRHNELLRYVPAMAAAAEVQVDRWRKRPDGRRGTVMPIDSDMTETTFTVIANTILAGCDAHDAGVLKRTNDEFLDHITWPLVMAMLGLPEWVWHPGRKRMLAAAAGQREAIARLIARRRSHPLPEGNTDILGRLLEARHPETGAPMPDAMLSDNLATFLIAGHETTAKALTWALYVLARAPQWQEAVREEVLSVAGTSSIGAEHIARLPLTERVVKETLRLYPPAPVLTRIAGEEVELGGVHLKKGALIAIPIYAVQRHNTLWEDPDRFDPDRFLPEREAKYARTQYMPFGFGPRTCIGASFGVIEAVTLLATFVRGARFAWDGRHTPEPISRITLRPKGGMPLHVTVL